MAFSVSYTYQILDRFSKPLNKIARKSKVFERNMRTSTRAADKFSKKMLSVGSGIAAVGGIMIARDFLGTFVDFETAMNKLGAVALASSGDMELFSKKAQELGSSTAFSASDAAKGMTFLKMAGLEVDEVLNAIGPSLQLAAAGGIELSTAADIATNVMAQMGLGVKDLTKINDVLAMAQSKANFSITEMFDAMRPTAVTAKNLGLEIEELGAVLGVMANSGEKGSIAGTLFRRALTNIAGPSSKQIKLYKKLGINLREFVEESGKIKNLKGFVGKLHELQNAGKLTVPQLQALFGEQGFRAMQILADKGSESLENMQKKLTNVGGTAEKMTKIQLRGLPGVIKMLSSAWQGLQIAIVDSGIGTFLEMIGNTITFVLSGISKLPKPILFVVGTLGALLAVVGPLMVLFGTLAALWPALVAGAAAFGAILAFITGPIGLIVIGIAALVAGIMFLAANWDKVKAFFGFGGDESVAAKGGASNSLNGAITVSAEAGTKVKNAQMNTDMPGNLGMNMAPAGA